MRTTCCRARIQVPACATSKAMSISELHQIPEFAIYTERAIRRAFMIAEHACERIYRRLNALQMEAVAFYILDADEPMDLAERIILASEDILPPNPIRPQTDREIATEATRERNLREWKERIANNR